MDWMLTEIVWDTDGKTVAGLPSEAFVNWASGCNSSEEAIDLVSDFYGYCILSCKATEE